GGPAYGGALGVGGAVDARAVAVFREVAGAGRGAAGRAGADERVGGAIVGDAVARLVDVTDARGRPAHGGALGVGGAVDGGPVAVLLEVADAGREAARRAGSGNLVGRAVVRDAVAAVIDVADACRRSAHRRALDVVRTAGARSRALLVDVAHAGGGPTRGPRRKEAVGGTVVAHAVAALCDVTD